MVGQPKVLLKPVGWTTPTLWSHMRLCRLRAVLSTSREADNWVLHSPRAWLGTAFHRLVAAAPGDEPEAAHFWDAAISEILSSISAHPLELTVRQP